MTDREKVLSWLEGLTDDDWRMYHSDTEVQNIAKEAFELLKEQEAVVRCRDCKNAVCYDDNEVVCTHIDSNGSDTHSVDWFCADGERKDGD